LIRQIQDANHNNPRPQNGTDQAYAEATDILHKQGIFSRYEFQNAVESYLNLSIDAALTSDDPIIKAVAMLDRRLGQRRLAKMQLDGTEHALVKLFYDLRLQAEQSPELNKSQNN
jgi:hypothetical protein